MATIASARLTRPAPEPFLLLERRARIDLGVFSDEGRCNDDEGRCITDHNRSTAFVAVVVGPLMSIYVAQRQIRASVVSANRQAWINSLRNALSDYMAKHAMALNLNRLSHADQSSLPRIEEILLLNTRIELLVNPKEPDHARLVKMLGEMTNAINRSPAETSDVDLNKQREQVLALCQSILKREWERVKRGD